MGFGPVKTSTHSVTEYMIQHNVCTMQCFNAYILKDQYASGALTVPTISLNNCSGMFIDMRRTPACGPDACDNH